MRIVTSFLGIENLKRESEGTVVQHYAMGCLSNAVMPLNPNQSYMSLSPLSTLSLHK
jgi:hypothetical protein